MNLNLRQTMKRLGLLIIIFSSIGLWNALPALSVGTHSTSEMWRHIEPVVDTAIDGAKTKEDRKQLYAQVSEVRRSLESYAEKGESAAMRAGAALAIVSVLQFAVGVLIMMRGTRRQGPRPMPKQVPQL